MKNRNLFVYFLTILLISVFGSLQSCRPDETEDYKPNIYLYPLSKSQVDVEISFPSGGEVTTSIPAYKNGWKVSVDTTGKINNQYDYLFYESRQPNTWQLKKGWVIRQNELKDFFVSNLSSYGFKGKEINDFTEYWLPRFKKSAYYKIYPQETAIVDKLIRLTISPKPDHLLRLHYVIKETNEPTNNLDIPTTPPKFNRQGFYVTEWGVIL
ncbi:MAG: hypothetical protein WCI31_00345 [Prolixibacteraceae bacterium]